MNFKTCLFSFLTIFLYPSYVLAADVQRGKELHNENCIRCHVSMVGGDGSGIYIREDRKMDSLAALNKQVRRCKTSLGVSWPDQQIEDVITYLNNTFYKFAPQKTSKDE